MAFILDQLTNVRGQDKSPRVQGKWMYRTTDARATVLAADYFLTAYTLVPSTDTTTTTSALTQNCSNKFYVGDIIEIQQVDSSDRPLDEYRVVIAYVETGGSSTILVEALLEGELVAVGRLADVSTASNVDISFGAEVELTNITTVLGGALTVSDDAITTKLDSSSGTAVDGGAITVAYSGSAKGDEDMATPYANRTATIFNIATDGASTGTQTLDIILRGMPTAGKVRAVTIKIPDISTVSSADAIASPYSGVIKKIESTLLGVIITGDAIVTTKIGTPAAGTAITTGALTIAFTSAAVGDIDVVYPTAENTIVEGELLAGISNGGSTDAAPLYVTFYILQS